MQQQQSGGQSLLGFLFLAFMSVSTYTLIKALVDSLSGLDPRVAAAIVAAIATIVVSVFSVLVSKNLEQSAKITQEIRDKKIPVYEELIDFVFKIVKATKKGEQLTEEEIETFMFDFTQQVVVWGSDEILQVFYQFRHSNDSGDGRQAALRMEELLLAIRRDLGHSNKGLSQGRILGLFINDFDQYMLEGSLPHPESNSFNIPNRT